MNAYVDEAMRDQASLPIEFKMLGITPGKWTPQVVISRHQALTSNVPNEATHVRAIGALGSTAKLRELLLIEGGEPALTLDPLIDPKTFPADVLAVYDAFRDPIEFAPADVASAYRAPAQAAADAPAMAGAAARRAAGGVELRLHITQEVICDPYTIVDLSASSLIRTPQFCLSRTARFCNVTRVLVFWSRLRR